MVKVSLQNACTRNHVGFSRKKKKKVFSRILIHIKLSRIWSSLPDDAAAEARIRHSTATERVNAAQPLFYVGAVLKCSIATPLRATG